MFIHLGNDKMIPIEKVIGILNIEPPIPDSLKEIMELGLVERNLDIIGQKEKAKSLIITPDKLYLSPISSLTLFKRSRSQL